MIKDQNSDECIDAFEQYLKDTKDYNRRVSHGDSLSYTDDEWFIWQNAWRSCINQNALLPVKAKVKFNGNVDDIFLLMSLTNETFDRCKKALIACSKIEDAKQWLTVNKPNYAWNGK